MEAPGVNTSATSLPPPGALVGGKYQVERYIAEGGMGVIARGRHVELDEPIALKFLKPDIVTADASGTLSGRFLREARATIKIKSEHVPRIFDVSTLPNGIPYIVMELLDGEDLDRRLETHGPLPVVFVIDMLLQSLEALAAAHSLGMVHRDFKPANLFLSRGVDGTSCIKVLDFGIAKLVDQNGKGDQGLTGTSAVMGSPRYMAPEQMRSSRDVDARADVWAVGTTIYELLAGVPSFNGESLTHVCAAILQDEPERVGKRRPDVPPGLEAVVQRCLAKQPADRYPNVAELAAALAPFGTAPSADELARRVARVLGAPPPNPSDPSIVPSRHVTGASSSGSAQTNTAWGTSATSSGGRRTVWVLGGVFAVLLLVGGVLGGVALLRSRGSNPATATATSAPVGHPSVVAAPPETAPSPVAVVPSTTSATPSSTAVVATPVTAAPPTKGKPPVEPKAPEQKPAPTAEPKAAPKPTAKPTASPTGGGLWDDRK